MIKKICFSIAAWFIMGTSLLWAQNQKAVVSVKNNAFGFVPQYTIVGGFRIDYDRKLSTKSNQWLIASPQFYMVSKGRLWHEFKNLYGFGIDLKHRIFLANNSLLPLGFYFQYGFMFQHFIITDTRSYTQAYIDNGVEYYSVTTGEITTQVNKFGGNFNIGYQWMVGNKVYIDVYSGAGIRLSFDNRNEGFHPWYNDT